MRFFVCRQRFDDREVFDLANSRCRLPFGSIVTDLKKLRELRLSMPPRSSEDAYAQMERMLEASRKNAARLKSKPSAIGPRKAG